jgi:hypothetical protein
LRGSEKKFWKVPKKSEFGTILATILSEHFRRKPVKADRRVCGSQLMFAGFTEEGKDHTRSGFTHL